MRKADIPCPEESVEQTCLFRWAAYERGRYPELDLMHHCPNGGSRNKVEAARLKAQGVKAGVPDIFLPVARCGYHGLFIEMKRQRGGTVSPEQKEWIKNLLQQGYLAVVCKGYQDAVGIIESYMEGSVRID